MIVSHQSVLADPAQVEPRPGPVTPSGFELVDEILATVNGEVITSSDIVRRHEQWQLRASAEEILVQLVRELALFQAAQRAGAAAPEELIARLMQDRIRALGGDAPYRRQLKLWDKSPEQDLQEVRRLAVIHEFVMESLGFVPESKLMRPHLAQQVWVGPREKLAFFRQNRQRFVKPGIVSVGVFALPKSSGPDSECRTRIEQVRRAATQPDSSLRAAGRAESEGIYREFELGSGLLRLISPEIEQFARTATPGELSPVVQTKQAWVVTSKLVDEPAREQVFSEVHERIEALLGAGKRRRVEALLTAEILEQAVIQPAALVASRSPDRDAGRNAPEGQAGFSLPSDPDSVAVPAVAHGHPKDETLERQSRPGQAVR